MRGHESSACMHTDDDKGGAFHAASGNGVDKPIEQTEHFVTL